MGINTRLFGLIRIITVFLQICSVDSKQLIRLNKKPSTSKIEGNRQVFCDKMQATRIELAQADWEERRESPEQPTRI